MSALSRCLFLLPLLFCLNLYASEQDCHQWLTTLDTQIQQQQARDSRDTHIPGFVHLRTNRWLADLQTRAKTTDQQQQWLSLAADAALRGFRAELARTGDDGPDYLHGLQYCIDQLARQTDFDAVPEITVTDSYHTWQRVLGVYPVSRWLATPFIRRYHQEMTARLEAPAPQAQKRFYPMGELPSLVDLSGTNNNPLGIPLPDEEQLKQLFQYHAPVLEVSALDEDNLPGGVMLDEQGQPLVDTQQPASYVWTSWTRFQNQPLLQLNYQFWFTRRPAQHWLDPYAGELDSLIWRVTLDQQGKPLVYDSIHGCGCYHKVFLARQGLKPTDIKGDRPVFYPETINPDPQQRIHLQIQPDTHYLVGANSRRTLDSHELPLTPYPLLSAEQLRQLSTATSATGLYDRQGLIQASKRLERWALWPLGVPSAGAMRQPGQHAIAFIGKRHFDDPDLLDHLVDVSEK